VEVTNTWHNYSTKSVQHRLYYYTCLDMFVRWWFSVIKWLVTTVCTRWLPLSASCCCLSNSWQQWQNHNNHDIHFWKVRKTLLLRPWLWCKDLSACISKKNTSKPYEIFCTCYSVAVARSSSDDNAICYVLPVAWTFVPTGQLVTPRSSELTHPPRTGGGIMHSLPPQHPQWRSAFAARRGDQAKLVPPIATA